MFNSEGYFEDSKIFQHPFGMIIAGSETKFQ